MVGVAAERHPRVGGIVPFSALDYPGRLSAVVFLQGCPWRCGYCHNPHLQVRGGEVAGWEAVRALLARRKGLIEALVFSGGEPTADPALDDAIDEVRACGFEVGLHSAGIYPRRLARALRRVDWVGLDVKAPFDRYDAITGVAGSGARARASIEAVLAAAGDYEVRTTFDPGAQEEGEVRELAATLAGLGVRHYALQEARPAGPVRASAALLGELAAIFPHFTFREGR